MIDRLDSTVAVPPRRLTTAQQLVIAADRGIYRIARGWLTFATALFSGYFLACLAAPGLVAAGLPGVARPIYSFAGLFCHQRADRSFHLWGHQVACCERCIAIYGAMAVIAWVFAFGALGHGKPQPLAAMFLAAPAAVDGFGQLAGVWHSTTATRMLTGALLGVAMAWLLLSFLAPGFATMRTQLEARFARLVAAGLVERPLR